MEHEQRFMKYVSPEPMSGCWLWTGALNSSGYGKFKIDGKQLLSHRVAYELFRAPIPAGLQIDHLCRVTCCVNPSHMEAVSCRTNTLRGTSFSAENAKKTHCIHGHEFTEANTYYPHRATLCRYCRACHRDSMQRRREATA